jgi:hypothetical protein
MAHDGYGYSSLRLVLAYLRSFSRIFQKFFLLQTLVVILQRLVVEATSPVLVSILAEFQEAFVLAPVGGHDDGNLWQGNTSFVLGLAAKKFLVF